MNHRATAKVQAVSLYSHTDQKFLTVGALADERYSGIDAGQVRQLATVNPNRLLAHMNGLLTQEERVGIPCTSGFASQLGDLENELDGLLDSPEALAKRNSKRSTQAH